MLFLLLLLLSTHVSSEKKFYHEILRNLLANPNYEKEIQKFKPVVDEIFDALNENFKIDTEKSESSVYIYIERERDDGDKWPHNFELFLERIFYIGRSTHGRPFSHLADAIGEGEKNNFTTEKIYEIWAMGGSVIVLIAEKRIGKTMAGEKEASIIYVIGGENAENLSPFSGRGEPRKLTNKKVEKIQSLNLPRSKIDSRKVARFGIYSLYAMYMQMKKRDLVGKVNVYL